jgi:DNA-cytosine methyltransferase
MNVVSLFNGMNTGRQALENVGIKVNKYYSSEIKPYAIELTQYHFPDTIQVGDVTKWREWDIDWSSIDLILSGSPCQDLSAAGKRAGIHGAKSSLFFTFVDILNHIKLLNPNVLFLQENVGSASKLDVGIMSRALGVYPVRINSKLVTAQLRDRYYWSNIRTKQDGLFGDIVTDIPQPIDKGIMFKDIITDGYVERVKANCLLEGDYEMFIKDEIKQDLYLKSRISKGKQTPNLIYENKTYQINESKESNGVQPYMQNRIYYTNGKAPCLTKEKAHYLKYQTSELIYEVDNELRCKTNTNKGFDVVTENDCLDLSYPTSTTRRSRVTKGKAPCLTESNNNLYSYKDGIVRTVNKVEMCRLQGFPDDYCDILSTAKAGSLLGDGWTLPVIEHIFSFIN